MIEPILLFGIPVDFILFALTLLGVALFHRHTLPVALTGLAAIVVYKLVFTGFKFGAGLGGGGPFTVLPFSIAQGLPNAFARRMARNTQLILLEESQLWRVADPASGSGYVESLTHDLCERAWALFQGFEKTGKLPAFDSRNVSSDPIIGTKAHQLPKEFEAAVESTP